MSHFEAITELLRENAPAALNRDGDRVHIGSACVYATPQQQPLTAKKALDLAFLVLLPAPRLRWRAPSGGCAPWIELRDGCRATPSGTAATSTASCSHAPA